MSIEIGNPDYNDKDFEEQLGEVLIDVSRMLISKNKKYGDSALKPCRVFSKADNVEGIRVRIDDKLSRIANAQLNEDEDPEWDLLGYLVMLQIAKRYHEKRVDGQNISTTTPNLS